MNNDTSSRYSRNTALFDGSTSNQAELGIKQVLVVGCGGLGGYVIEGLARAGVCNFVLCDPDVFEASNLNRQLLALPSNLGMAKAEIAKQRIIAINPNAKVQAHTQQFCPAYLAHCDIVLDCLGGAISRLFLENSAKEAGLVCVSAGISGYSALITTTYPHETGLGKYMQKAVDNKKEPSENHEGSPVSTVMFAASIQVSEALQVLIHNTASFRHTILLANLKEARFHSMQKL